MKNKQEEEKFVVMRVVIPLEAIIKIKRYCKENFLSTSDGVLQMIERFFETERFFEIMDKEENKR